MAFSPPGHPPTSWELQANWYIDPVNGNDSNQGASLSDPIKTFAEVKKRVPEGRFQQTVTFYILNDIPDTDPVNIIAWQMKQRPGCRIYGVRQLVTTGTMTAYSARVPASNLPNRLTDSSVADWTPYLNNLLVPTSGSANAYPCWIAKDLGSNQAMVTSFYARSLGEQQPTTGNTYSIYRLPKIASLNIFSSGGFIQIQDIDLRTTGIALSGFYAGSVGGINLYYCLTPQTMVTGNIFRKYNCLELNNSVVSGGFSMLFAGLVRDPSAPNIEIESGSQMQISDGTIFLGMRIEPINAGFVRIYDAGVFDSPSEGFDLHGFGLLRAETLWGSGNAGAFIYTAGSGKVCYNGHITGTGSSPGVNDLVLNGVSYSWSDVNLAGFIASPDGQASIGPI